MGGKPRALVKLTLYLTSCILLSGCLLALYGSTIQCSSILTWFLDNCFLLSVDFIVKKNKIYPCNIILLCYGWDDPYHAILLTWYGIVVYKYKNN